MLVFACGVLGFDSFEYDLLCLDLVTVVVVVVCLHRSQGGPDDATGTRSASASPVAQLATRSYCAYQGSATSRVKGAQENKSERCRGESNRHTSRRHVVEAAEEIGGKLKPR